MTKQEFLAMSLPYGIKMVSNNGDNNYIAILDGIQNGIYYDEYGSEFNDYKPILRPLSDLTKEIEHKGEKFVPMKKIAIYNPNNVEYLIECVVTGLVEYIVLRQLIEWHFDLFDGIKNNEAIDVNTLEENPYK